MSRLHPQNFPCTRCGAALELGIVSSINADRRPDLRAVVLDDSFQRGQCAGCGLPFRVEPDLTYHDSARGQWLLVRPARMLVDWAPLEQLAAQAFDRAHGDEAPPEAQALGARMRPRIAFGWAAFREKLLCGEHGLDDTALELAKLALMRSVDSMPIGDTLELRLVGVEGDTLAFDWLRSDGDFAIERIELPRALVDEIAADADGTWAALRSEVSAGPYVDINRVLVPAEDEAEAAAP